MAAVLVKRPPCLSLTAYRFFLSHRALGTNSSTSLPPVRPFSISSRFEYLGIHVQSNFADAKPPKFVPNKCSQIPPVFSSGSRYLSSQASAASRIERLDEELDIGFSEANQNVQRDLDYAVELEGGGGSSLEWKWSGPNLGKILSNENKIPVHTLLDKYVSEGYGLNASVISHAMLTLRKFKMYGKALQFLEWLEAKKALDFTEHNYASRLDLIAKLHDLQKAEQYIELIPDSFRGELVYRTLLANCVLLGDVNKAEEVYNKMKDLNFSISVFTCNQMMILYKTIDKKKIADVLHYMVRENVKPTLVTFRLLIETKGRWLDISGMEHVIQVMKDARAEPDMATKAVMAKYYIAAGLKEKAKSVLLDIEGGNLKDARFLCSKLIPLYASLGEEDEVERVWKICEQNPNHDEYMAVINAWGKLKQIDKAEAVFNELEKDKTLSSKHYAAMLSVYADHKMLEEGSALVKRMRESGCPIGPLTWDALVKLYVAAGHVDKADAVLQKLIMVSSHKVVKPMFNSFMNIMKEYAKRGDVHNSEKMLYMLRQYGYSGRLGPFRTLLEAYMNSKIRPYGFTERMMAENVFPSRGMMSQISQLDPFKETEV